MLIGIIVSSLTQPIFRPSYSIKAQFPTFLTTLICSGCQLASNQRFCIWNSADFPPVKIPEYVGNLCVMNPRTRQRSPTKNRRKERFFLCCIFKIKELMRKRNVIEIHKISKIEDFHPSIMQPSRFSKILRCSLVSDLNKASCSFARSSAVEQAKVLILQLKFSEL